MNRVRKRDIKDFAMACLVAWTIYATVALFWPWFFGWWPIGYTPFQRVGTEG